MVRQQTYKVTKGEKTFSADAGGVTKTYRPLVAERISAVETALAGPALAGAGSASTNCQYFAFLRDLRRVLGVRAWVLNGIEVCPLSLSPDSWSSWHKTAQMYDSKKLFRPFISSAVDLPGLLSWGEDHAVRNSRRYRTFSAFCAMNSEKPRTLRRSLNVSTRGGYRATGAQAAGMFASR